MRRVRQLGEKETRDQRDVASETGMLLRKRGQEEKENDSKRRKETLEAERLPANNAEALKILERRLMAHTGKISFR